MIRYSFLLTVLFQNSVAFLLSLTYPFVSQHRYEYDEYYEYECGKRHGQRQVQLLHSTSSHDHESNSKNNNNNNNNINDSNLHLLSLQFPQESFSKAIQQAWRWKDSVLGDGRDFFVPKPKTLAALNALLLQQCIDINIQECAVLSNCARFEIILVCNPTDTIHLTTTISNCIAAQIISHQHRPFPILQDQFSKFDRPELIQAIQPTAFKHTTPTLTLTLPATTLPTTTLTTTALAQDLSTHWTHLTGPDHICRHLALVAAGMAERPNRVGRPVPFRPFSSRDAHILRQLKRTEAIGPRVKTVLDYALRAGKAVRDVTIVPEIAVYHTFTVDPPAAIMEQVAKVAVIKGIEPLVGECVLKFRAMNQSEAIQELREQAEQLLIHDSNSKERAWINQQLHGPTLELREGKAISIVGTIQNIQLQLLKQRSRQTK